MKISHGSQNQGLGVGDADETLVSDVLTPVNRDNTGTHLTVQMEVNPYGKVFALLDDGTVAAWGDNTGLGLGLCGFGFVNKPTLVPGIPPMKKIATSIVTSFGCATDGTVWSWGATNPPASNNMDGRDVTQSATICSSAVYGPGMLNIGGSSCLTVSAGNDFGAVLTNDSDVYVWGRGVGRDPLKLTFPYAFTPLKIAASEDVLVYGLSASGSRELWVLARFPDSSLMDPVYRSQVGSMWFGRATLESFFDDFKYGDYRQQFDLSNRVIVDMSTKFNMWLLKTDANEAISYVANPTGYSTSGTSLEASGFVISDNFAGKKFSVTKFNALLEEDGASGVIWSVRGSILGGAFQESDWTNLVPVQPLTALSPSTSKWVNIFADETEVSATLAALDGALLSTLNSASLFFGLIHYFSQLREHYGISMRPIKQKQGTTFKIRCHLLLFKTAMTTSSPSLPLVRSLHLAAVAKLCTHQ
jgi:hypothetical protein